MSMYAGTAMYRYPNSPCIMLIHAASAQGNEACPQPSPARAARSPQRLSQQISRRAIPPQQATVATNTPPAAAAALPAALSGLSGPLMDSVPFMVTLISCGQTAGGAAAPPDGPTSSVLFQNKRSRDYHGPYDSMRSAAGLTFLESAGGLDRGLDLLRNMFSMCSESEAQRLIEVGGHAGDCMTESVGHSSKMASLRPKTQKEVDRAEERARDDCNDSIECAHLNGP